MNTSNSQIVIYDKLYIPKTLVDEKTIAHLFTHRSRLKRSVRAEYWKRLCGDCKWLGVPYQDKDGSIVQCRGQSPTQHACGNFNAIDINLEQDTIYLWDDLDTFWGIPRVGGVKKLTHLLSNVTLKDIRVKKGADTWIELKPFIQEYSNWNDQNARIQELLKAEGGILQAATAWGKTICLIGLITLLKQKTLILVDEGSLAKQWIDKFYFATNLNEVENKGTPLLGYYPDTKMVHPITITTYQQFRRKIDKFRQFSANFGLTLVDEAHLMPALCFSKVLNNSASYYRYAATATPERTDGLETILSDIVGDITAQGITDTITGKYTVEDTSAFIPSIKTWQQMEETLYGEWINDKEGKRTVSKPSGSAYLDDIIKSIKNDVDKNNILLVFCTRHVAMIYIKQQLELLGIQSEIVNKDVPITVREKIYSAMNNGNLRVIITGSVVSKGIDIWTLNSAHIVTPVSSPPRLKQIVGRIRRPIPKGKEGIWNKLTNTNQKECCVHLYRVKGYGPLFGVAKKAINILSKSLHFTT